MSNQINHDSRINEQTVNDILRNGKLLTATEKIVFLDLYSYIDECTPSFATIAKDTCLCRSTVKRAISSMIEKGVIEKVRRTRDDGGYLSNRYILDTSEETWSQRE